MSSVIEVDTKGVYWPQTPQTKKEMRQAISRYAKEGYYKFATMTHRCLNGIESPGPDSSGPPGWDYLDFFHDCEPHLVDDESAVFSDVRLFARKGIS